MANSKRNELEFWLPSEFLTDEDIHMNTGYLISDSTSGRFRFPIDFSKRCAPFNTGSSLSSPVESVLGSTETESEEEDSILSELTRQLTQKFSPAAYPTTHEKNLLQSGSPQSTLAHVESWSGRSTVSSKGSSNGPSRVSSPPYSPLESNNKAWDLIYKAAGLVEGLKSNGAGGQPSVINSGIFERQRSFSTHPPPPSKSPIHSSIHLNDLVRIEELLGQQGCGMRSRQVIYNPNGCNLDRNISGRVGSSGDSAAGYGGTWPNMQIGNKNHQQLGAGVTAGGLISGGGFGAAAHGYGCESGSGVGGIIKSQRVGTGVFLPRRYGDNSSCNSADSRKKSGYSSAYSANKVPVINNNLSNRSGFAGHCQSQKLHGDTIADYEALLARRASTLTLKRTTSFPEVAINHELCLPQEWTY